MLTVESADFHDTANRRIKRAMRFVGDGKREVHRLEEHLTHDDGCPDVCAELPQFASLVESRAAGFDTLKPFRRALDRRVALNSRGRCLPVPDDLNGDHRSHDWNGADNDVGHFRYFARWSACITA